MGELDGPKFGLTEEQTRDYAVAILRSRNSETDVLSVIQKPTCLLRPVESCESKPTGKNDTYVFFTERSRVSEPEKEVPARFMKDGVCKGIAVTDWLAYPLYKPAPNADALGQFKLAHGLYYSNAIELAASCMEMSIIGAMNVVNLLLLEHRQKTDPGCPILSSLINAPFKP
ncbi:Prenylcysteine oxidase-like [Cichlidogyrus casuarinus]|uniref:Prenylcysteine oxidase-like n=1 Tax=Cichlidogyrus casuarinus TaxID=1844966 RepID=A0ABD2QDW0_9PLAT